jgi:hypothetical protein
MSRGVTGKHVKGRPRYPGMGERSIARGKQARFLGGQYVIISYVPHSQNASVIGISSISRFRVTHGGNISKTPSLNSLRNFESSDS